MRRLTESLLELARLDGSQEGMKRERFDLAKTTQDCVERLRPLARQRGVQILCDLAPAEALGNADQLGQVLTNLVHNAIHYNQENGEVRIRTGTEGGAVILTVADTGVGIAAEDLPHVFERLYGADKSRARANGRTGLGLAICKAIVDAHGGRVEVSRSPGAGTTFTVRLVAATVTRATNTLNRNDSLDSNRPRLPRR